jgi:ribose 1,5-bisphosphokinase PhnN
MKLLLWVAGATASGKDTLIDEVLSPLWFISIKTSSMLRRAIPVFYDWIQENVDGISPVKLNELGTGIREVHGQDFFTQLAIHEPISWTQRVINGIRREEEFDAIHSNNGRVILVISSTKEALRRAIEVRQRWMDQTVNKSSLRQHIWREKREVDPLSYKADLVLVNDFKTKEEFIDFARWKIINLLK